MIEGHIGHNGITEPQTGHIFFADILKEKTFLETDKMIDMDPPEIRVKDIHAKPRPDLKFVKPPLISVKRLNPTLQIYVIIHGVNEGRPDHVLIPFPVIHQVFVVGVEKKTEIFIQGVL